VKVVALASEANYQTDYLMLDIEFSIPIMNKGIGGYSWINCCGMGLLVAFCWGNANGILKSTLRISGG
jgi:hypothetical protein